MARNQQRPKVNTKTSTCTKTFVYHARKAINLKCSIWFLNACLYLGFTPRGLQPKFPITGLPLEIRDSVNQFSLRTSFNLTNLVLYSYKPLLKYHDENLVSTYFKLLNENQNIHTPKIINLLGSLHKILINKSKTLIRKLVQTCDRVYNLSPNDLTYYQNHPVYTLISPPPKDIFGSNDFVPKTNFVVSSIFQPCTPYFNYYYHNTFQNTYPYHYYHPNFCYQLHPVTPPKVSTNVCQDNMECINQMPINASSEITDEKHDTCITIENLSSYKPNQYEKLVLEKGLTFAPTPKFNHFKLVTDALEFSRKIRLKHHFEQLKDNSGPTTKTDATPASLLKFKNSSTCDLPPLPQNHPIEQFTTLILSNISDPNFADTLNTTKNLTKDEYKAINTLKRNPNIMILPADKGNSIVIMNAPDYINEANRQLSDTSTYKELDEDLTIKHNEQIQEYIEINGPQQGLSPKTISLLTPKYPRTPIFYTLPKIHKPARPPPGRPIVSSFGCPTERISAYVDELLQPHVTNLPSYTKDTNHFLTKIHEINNQPLPENLFLVSIDVESLYTNIPHNSGLDACKHYLNLRPPNSKPSTNFILTLISLILSFNNFKFQDKNYLQIRGTAMGTRMAPSYANLYMGLLEKSFLAKQELQPFTWIRFIDDIFLIWQHGIESLLFFLNDLNLFSPLNFNWKISQEFITFLDVDIYLKDNSLKTKIHVKETNKMQYLHYTSCHPMHIKKSIPKGLSIRAQNLCSDQVDFNNYINKLTCALSNRGYPSKLINNQIKSPKTNTNNIGLNDPKFITNYFPGLYKINKILKVAFPILQNHQDTRNLFSTPPKVIFSTPPNLQNILSRPKLNYKQPQISECKPCNTPRCGTCKILQPAKSFSSSSTNMEYPIHGNINCNSKNIVYQLICKNCPKDYIGKTTTPLRFRITNHRFDVSHQNSNRPLSQHAIEHNITKLEDGFILKGIYQQNHDLDPQITETKLRSIEIAHQLIMKSRQPEGLNLR